MTVDRPEDRRLEHDAGADRRVFHRLEQAAADAVLEVAAQQLDGSLAPRPEPGRREFGVVARAAIEELDPDAMARQQPVQLAHDRLDLRPDVDDPAPRERLGERGQVGVLRDPLAHLFERGTGRGRGTGSASGRSIRSVRSAWRTTAWKSASLLST